MADFTMPSLGADMDEGTLLEWLVHPGDTVHKGDILAVVDTSKAAVEIETFVDGVVGELLVEPGTTVAVGTPLATLAPAAGPAEVPAAVPAEVPAAAPAAPAEPAVHSPLVRRLAGQLGVDLAAVTGTGRTGTITRADVIRADAEGRVTPAASPPPAPVPATATGSRRRRVTPYARRLATELGVDLDTLTVADGAPVRVDDVRAAATARPVSQPVSQPGAQPGAQPAVPPVIPVPVSRAPTSAPSRSEQMRATIAALMTRAKREIPHYYLSTTVDLGRATAWMQERNRDRPVSERLVPAALLLKATALAAAEMPQLNGFWVDDGFRPGSGVHLGIAVSLRGGGLVAPALHDTDTLSLDEVMAGMRDLVTRARAGRLRGSELSDPTITVTNLGDQGVEAVYGVIYPPQVALVGFGRVSDRPFAVDGLLGVRPVTTLTLSADHRATDGFTGGRFLAAVDRHLQEPEEL